MAKKPSKKKQEEKPEVMLSMKEAAALVGVHYMTLYRYVQAGTGPVCTKSDVKTFSGTKYTFKKSDVEAWMDARNQQKAA